MAVSAFDYVKSVSETKERIEDISGYEPFLTNKALSLHKDTLADAIIMNLYPDLHKQMQYDYYLYALRKGKRYGSKWPKPEKNDDLEVVMSYYKYNRSKAKDALLLLSKEYIDVLREKLNTGGTSK